MQNKWDGQLEIRTCRKDGCGRQFKVLPASTQFYCHQEHNPYAFEEPKTDWTKHELRAHVSKVRTWAKNIETEKLY